MIYDSYIKKIKSGIHNTRVKRTVSDEIEEYLTDFIEYHKTQGMSEEESFDLAKESIGNIDQMCSSYNKVHGNILLLPFVLLIMILANLVSLIFCGLTFFRFTFNYCFIGFIAYLFINVVIKRLNVKLSFFMVIGLLLADIIYVMPYISNGFHFSFTNFVIIILSIVIYKLQCNLKLKMIVISTSLVLFFDSLLGLHSVLFFINNICIIALLCSLGNRNILIGEYEK